MTKTHTQHDVIRYIYRETSEEEDLAIRNAMLLDQNLMDFYKEMNALAQQIKILEAEPSTRAIKAIIDYAQIDSLQSIG